jgi:hypothetical protein
MPAEGAAAGPANRLGPATPAYSLLYAHDLPQEWLQPLGQDYLEEVAVRMEVRRVVPTTVVELPDYRWAWHYERWARAAAAEADRRGEQPLSVMVVSRGEFRNLPTERQRADQAGAVLHSLVETGRPLPLFARVFVPKP